MPVGVEGRTHIASGGVLIEDIEASVLFRGQSVGTESLSRGETGLNSPQKFTVSYWVNDHYLRVPASTTAPYKSIHFQLGDDTNKFSGYVGNAGYNANYAPSYHIDYSFNNVSQKLRVTTSHWSANGYRNWNHVLIKVDTTQAEETERMKLFINNELQVDWSFNQATVPLNSTQKTANTGSNIYIGRGTETTNKANAAISRFYFLDGISENPDKFGTYDDNGRWSPVEYAGSYGTQGFLLKFENASNLGLDSSPNARDFVANNMTNLNQVQENPTIEYNKLARICHNHITSDTAKWSYLHNFGMVSHGGSTRDAIASFEFVSRYPVPETGKWHYEHSCYYNGNRYQMYPYTDPIQYQQATNNFGIRPDYYRVSATGYFPNETPASDWKAYTPAFPNGQAHGQGPTDGPTANMYDRYGWGPYYSQWSIDRDNNIVYLKNSNTEEGSRNFDVPTTLYHHGQETSGDYNYGGAYNVGELALQFNGANVPSGLASTYYSDDNGYGRFVYPPRAGYLAECSRNIDATPKPINCDDHFKTVTYTGNSSSQSVECGFKPDLVWIKARNAATPFVHMDAVRGVTKTLESSATTSEQTKTNNITSFDTTGFTLGDHADVNNTGINYVAFCWKGGNGTEVNNDGAIQTTVSRNVEAGFSVVTYTGDGTNSTIGVGLDDADFIIFKNLDAVTDWYVASSGLQNWTQYARLNRDTEWVTVNIANPTGNLINIAPLVNPSGQRMVAYVWKMIPHYSSMAFSFGTDGSGGGQGCRGMWTGFKPKFIMWKHTWPANSDSWFIVDEVRDSPYRMQSAVRPNSTTAETATLTQTGMLPNSHGFETAKGYNTYLNAANNYYFGLSFGDGHYWSSRGEFKNVV